jgi:acetylornithine deacetylase
VRAWGPGAPAPGLARPAWLVLSYDEEVGCLAAPTLVPALLARARYPAFAIVGEPSQMRVAPAHRGIATFTTTVVGRAGHSGSPEAGVSAIAAAAACIGFLDRLDAGLAATEADAGGAAGSHGRASLNVGRIAGGTAVNTIAAACRFDWECRTWAADAANGIEAALAGHVAQAVLPAMQARAPEARIETRRIVAVPPLAAAPASIVARIQALVDDDRTTTVPFTSEAGFFAAAGVPAVILGPGDPAVAHQANEHIAVQQLGRCVTFLHRLADWLRSDAGTAADPLASGQAVP